mgnify:CR=1 FL=1
MERYIAWGVDVIHFTDKEIRSILQQLYYGKFFFFLPKEDVDDNCEVYFNKDFKISTEYRTGVEIMFQGIRIR